MDDILKVKAILEDENPNFNVEVKGKLCDLTGLPKSERIYYFGVLHAGGVDSIELKDENDNTFITIAANSQIISIFSSIAVTGTVQGRFYGYQLQLISKI